MLASVNLLLETPRLCTSLSVVHNNLSRRISATFLAMGAKRVLNCLTLDVKFKLIKDMEIGSKN